MTIRSLRGDVPAVAKVVTITVATAKVGAQYTVTCNGKRVSYTAAAASVSSVVDGLVAAIAASTIPEFTEFTPAAGSGFLTLTANVPGQDFAVSVSASGAATVTVSSTVTGREAVNEIQKLELMGAFTGGTFTLAADFGSGTETSAAIAYGSSGTVVRDAIVSGCASVAAGDLAVIKESDTVYYFNWSGSFAAAEVPEFAVDGSLLTGNGDVLVETISDGGGLSNEIQQMRVLGDAGAYTLAFNGSETTSLAWDATAAVVQTALEAVPTIGAGNVLVFGGQTTANTHVFAFVFTGTLAGSNQSLIALHGGSLSAGGSGGGGETNTVSAGGQSGDLDEWQLIDLGGPTAGTYTLSVDGETTDAIDWNDDGSFVSQALEALSAVGSGNVTHFASNSSRVLHLIRFTGGLAGTNVSAISIGSGGLSGTRRTPVVTALQHGGAANQDEQWRITVLGAGGTFTLSDGTDTTSAISFGAVAGTIETRLETDLGSLVAVTVTGTGTVADPYLVTVDDPAATDLDQLIGDGSLLTGGGGLCTEVTPHDAGANAQQTVTRDVAATGGTFTLDGSDPVAYDVSAAALQSALEGVFGSGNVTATKPTANSWVATFTGALANQEITLMAADPAELEGGGAAITLETTTASRGPNHADDPLNWTGGRVPDSGDTVHITDGDSDSGLLYGLRWRDEFEVPAATFTADAATDTLTLAAGCDPDDGRIVRLTSDGTLPAGLAAATDYYVINWDASARTLQLAATLDGAAINITDAGTGTHTLSDPRTLTLIAGADFVADQIVRLRTDGTLPAGLAIETDYYVVNWDKAAGTLQLASTSGGAAIVTTDAGTGTHAVEVQLAKIIRGNRFTGRIGLPLFNDDGYYEYRPTHWAVGLLPDPVAENVTLGTGEGTGPSLEYYDFGGCALYGVGLTTGGSVVQGVPPCLLITTHAESRFESVEGEYGFAFYAGQTTTLSLTMRGGTVRGGKDLTLTRLDRTSGELLVDQSSFDGTIIIRG